jgi:UDP-N-acetylmuramoyl-L-alanyl-D-glutamate--2,6-diaminopimelate ligase
LHIFEAPILLASYNQALVAIYKLLKNKIIAILARWHFFGNPSSRMTVVGVTGTNGKTTVATLLYGVFTGLGYKCGLIGTTGNIVAGVESAAKCTTPGAIELNKLLNEMASKGCSHAFIEVSSHAMVESRISGIKFAGGIFTNLTQDHLDFHKNMANYFQAKRKFFERLPASAFAVSNVDDQYGAQMLLGIKARQFTYGFTNPADFSQKLASKLLGDFNSYNVLAVYAMATLLGEDPCKVKELLKIAEPPKGRFNCVASSNGITGIVDYAHTPDALANVLKTINRLRKKNQQVILVFGCGGDRDPIKRPIMGKIGCELSDIAIFTADNPRNEDPVRIIEQLQSDLTAPLHYKVRIIPDRREAIAAAVKLAKAGDYVLLAGKGHETYQEIQGRKHYFCDSQELKEALGGLT